MKREGGRWYATLRKANNRPAPRKSRGSEPPEAWGQGQMKPVPMPFLQGRGLKTARRPFAIG